MAPQRPSPELRPMSTAASWSRNLRRSGRRRSTASGGGNKAAISPAKIAQRKDSSKKDRQANDEKSGNPSREVSSDIPAAPSPVKRPEKLSIFKRGSKTIVRIFKIPAKAEEVEKMFSDLVLDKKKDAPQPEPNEKVPADTQTMDVDEE